MKRFRFNNAYSLREKKEKRRRNDNPKELDRTRGRTHTRGEIYKEISKFKEKQRNLQRHPTELSMRYKQNISDSSYPSRNCWKFFNIPIVYPIPPIPDSIRLHHSQEGSANRTRLELITFIPSNRKNRVPS